MRARTQEADLRTYLFDRRDTARTLPGSPDAPALDLELQLRRIAAQATARWGLAVEHAFVTPFPTIDNAAVHALAAATGECLANVAKHADTSRANLFVEGSPDQVEVIVRDRGIGFAPDAVEHRGLAHSINDRITEIGGTVKLTSRPGHGTEVRMTVPVKGLHL